LAKLNIGEAESLAEFAIELGANQMVYREMVYLPESQNIDREKVRELIVPPGGFLVMQDRILQQHEGKIQFSFLAVEHLKNYGKKSRADSFLTCK
jgi:hypothetical protein